MDDKNLDKWLESYQAPKPNADLSERILAAAASKPISSEVPSVKTSYTFAKRFMPIAATLLAVTMVGFTGLSVLNSVNAKTETALWQEAALDLGFDEIYNWVESEG